MQPKLWIAFIEPTASNIQTMLPAVVLALGLVTTAFGLPVTPEVATGVAQTSGEVPVIQQGEKTGFQGSPEVYPTKEQTVQQNVPVTKVENVPVVENSQVSYTESPVLLPIQPLSVVPVKPVGPVLRPVIVPAEAIAAGRVIIMSIEPIQQRSFQEVVPEKQVPYQQTVQQAIYTPIQTQVVEQQPYYVKPTEKQTQVQQTEQVQLQPNQEQLNKEQTVENYNPVPQIYNVQPVVTETGEKHVPYQVPVNTHPVETSVVQQVQKQGYQQTNPVQTQEVVPEYQQLYRPVAVENVEKKGSHQDYNTQQYPLHQVQHPQAEQQVYNVQPVEQQVYNVPQVEPQVQQVQPVPAEKQGYVQTQSVEPQQQATEKQAPHQQYVQVNEYVPVQVQSAEPFYQQQVYNVAAGQAENQVPYQQVTRIQTGTQNPEQKSKTPEVETHQQVENYAGQPPYNYGDKVPQIQQNNPTHVQNYSVQPSSVLSTQE